MQTISPPYIENSKKKSQYTKGVINGFVEGKIVLEFSRGSFLSVLKSLMHNAATKLVPAVRPKAQGWGGGLSYERGGDSRRKL